MKIDIPKEVLESIKKIIDYSIEDEENHYNKLFGEDKNIKYDNGIYAISSINHIYHDYELVNRFLLSQDLQADIGKEKNAD